MSEFHFRFLGHAMAVISDGEKNILVDPFYSGRFEFENHIEKMLSEPRERLDDLEKIDAVLITHSHGDHYDPPAIKFLVEKYGSKIFAPAEIIEDIREQPWGRFQRSVRPWGRFRRSKITPENALNIIDNKMRFRIGQIEVVCVTGFDNSFDAIGRPNKFSFIFEKDGKRLFFAGDCHRITDVQDDLGIVDFYAGWAIDYSVRAAMKKLKPGNFILIHYDRFTPGEFWCNRNNDEDKKRINSEFRDLNVIIPEGEKRTVYLT